MNHITRSCFAIALTIAGLLSLTLRAAEPATPSHHKAAIEACQECVTACESCATACLANEDVKAMIVCIQLERDCADLCSMAARLMARDSVHTAKACALCAVICQACADEAAKHKTDHGQRCVEACQKCADECKKMAK